MTTFAPSAELNFDVLPAEVEKYRDTIREFAQNVILPRAVTNDQAAHDEMDWDMVQQGHDLGLMRMGIPTQFGGLGLGALGASVVMEELAAADPGAALIFGGSGLAQAPILYSGDPHLQARYLPLFTGDKPVLACNAVTEELVGMDLIVPDNAIHARSMTTARREGDHYVLNGRKRFITNAPVATFASVPANMEGHPGSTGLTYFIVDLDQPGVTRGPVADKMGYRTALGGELVFDNAVVPAENVIGGELGGWNLNIAQSNMCRVTCAAIATGIARHALEKAITWCGERIQGGKPLYKHQFTAGKLARMTASVDAARLLYLHAANKADNQMPAPEYEPAVAKLIADRTAIDVADAAASLIGARGFVRDYGMEKVLRDAYGPRIYEGTPEALSILITEGIYRTEDED
ncbi:acyl-CoA dehydrogenase family protein [Streptomyces sp. BE147]|uniref:acyl-CoA dehydrogenase family protein n=1 Tax=unclassified Streptomyces TaxID=2593676 RepID=UPI002E76ED04|nr:acyl-CoA dehydrogenase family protein [Streptomyces sp. BE147]MEE1741518.1 acyl-CoA dehydrogenase family protein [Streptomyces sp. BE147]